MPKYVWRAAVAATVALAGWGVWHLHPAGGLAPPGPPPLPAPVLTAGAVPVSHVQAPTRSLPYKMVIRKISLWALIDRIGLRADGRIETPPLEKAERASWYAGSAAPGDPGPTVILGHVDGKDRIAAFFYLSKIRPGFEIEIVRQDRSIAIYEVTSVEQFAKARFPTARVYAHTTAPTLRLVTCGGKYDKRSSSYADNIVVFATMTGFRPAA